MRKINYNGKIQPYWWWRVKGLINYYTVGWWSIKLQLYLYKRGIYWHNWLRNECTPGFECCIDKCTPEEKQILNQVAALQK